MHRGIQLKAIPSHERPRFRHLEYELKLNLRQALQASPQLFPFQIDEQTDAVRFFALAEQEYATASFLDDRMLTPGSRSAMIPWRELSCAAEGLPLRCHFIFHISHTGSTLLSRILGAHPDCFAIREPLILRSFAEGKYSDRIDCFLGLWSRTFRPNQTAVIKATSFVNEIAAELLQRVANSRAVLMYIPATSFIPSLLDGAMVDIDRNADARLMRLQRRGLLIDTSLRDLSAGERVAMSWLAEMVSLNDAASSYSERTLWLNFEEFLLNLELQIAKVKDHFRLSETNQSLATPQIMQRYAKRPEVLYDTDLRANLLEQANRKFRAEIERGLHWLEKYAAEAGIPQ